MAARPLKVRSLVHIRLFAGRWILGGEALAGVEILFCAGKRYLDSVYLQKSNVKTAI